MAILAAVGKELSERRPSSGKVVLLYQPAEETGLGAKAILQDERFWEAKPDYSFALHNLPGFPLGQILLRHGGFTSASKGASIGLKGSTAHAAQPETGRSPARAMCEIMECFAKLPEGLIPVGEIGFVTVVGSHLGAKAFGTAPGDAEVWATLRSETNNTMRELVSYVERRVREIAADQSLGHAITYQDDFPATNNAPEAVSIVRRAAKSFSLAETTRPFPWSEDFGRFTEISNGALFGLGSGKGIPELHNPDYDFPDELIPIGAQILCGIIDECSVLPFAV
jgi:metal-dependent amidase/aminoacylase/carboxypeptidase family protein